MKLVVIIPALNEQATIADVIGRIPRQIEGVTQVRVVVVDDGSSDRTGVLARQAGALVVRHLFNRGVGAAFRTGIQAGLDAGADVIVNMDADGQFNPVDIPTLVEPILAGRAEATTCTRFARPEYMPTMPAVKKWGNRMMCKLVGWICWGVRYSDVSCGFRAYSRQAAMKMTLFGEFTYTQETFIDLIAKGVRIEEVPLKVRGVRAVGKSRVASNLWAYAVRSATIISRAARDIRPLAFFGGIGAALLSLGVACGIVVFGCWLATGRTHPVKSVLVGSAVFLILGFLMIIFALLADMLGRQRQLMQEVVYRLRRHQLDESAARDAMDEPLDELSSRTREQLERV